MKILLQKQNSENVLTYKINLGKNSCSDKYFYLC